MSLVKTVNPLSSIRNVNFLRKNLASLLCLILLLAGYLAGALLISFSFSDLEPVLVEEVVPAFDNPFIGLFTGLLVICMLQSTTLAVIVCIAVASSSYFTLEQLVPVVMGINAGIPLTHTMISPMRTHKRKEFRRALTLTTLHSFFSLCAGLVLFPLEYFFAPLAHFIEWLVPSVVFWNNWLPGLTALAASHGWLQGLWLLLGLLLLSVCFSFYTQQARDRLREWTSFEDISWEKPLGVLLIRGFLPGLFVQSATTTFTLIIEQVISRRITLRKSYVYLVGSYLGSSSAGLLTALVMPSSISLQVALVHLCFLLSSLFILFPIPFLRYLPVVLSRRVALLTFQNRTLGVAFILMFFFLIPFLLILFTVH
jgi:sodium-dependent phosphate cotransporter